MAGWEALARAKAFLCWDVFPGLSIQLIRTGGTTSYYFPPNRRAGITLFCPAEGSDYSRALFLLFHEAGHHEQFLQGQNDGNTDEFRRLLDLPDGPERAAFEEKAWCLGEILLQRFLKEQQLSAQLLEEYRDFARESVTSYRGEKGSDFT